MLLLLFQIADQLYALDASHVVEVIPNLLLREVQSVPDYVVGVFNYRGTITRVVDLCYLIQGTASRPRFSTRIIMMGYLDDNGTHQHIGLMAERVTETLSRPDLTSFSAELTSAKPVPKASYLGDLFIDQKGMVQSIRWESLVLKNQSIPLLEGIS
jgi:chemotaxis-related protein WspB